MTDQEYLKTIRPHATESQIEQFCERVAICVADDIRTEIAIAIALMVIDYE